ncbi:MAG: LysR family transcriptional regulator [Neisseria sp.]|uniref:LysR family transcriptional regulator n=1 Tax=Neisseria sp. TaxID=192066 RepID=UPI0026DB8F0B|nr:LysR family transcriptional regulator [Neisseria sp.]MDO4640263.1 LysR family transcriptional regulator [Neisseria sp.]
MLNKLEALRYFLTSAETLHFKETAVRMSVSPQVVTRIIAELENEFGEKLFLRDTRNIKLTDFAEQLIPKAQKLLADSENLFNQHPNQDEMAGIVRITLPTLPENQYVLAALMKKISPYPELIIDWKTDTAKLHFIEDKIDIGLRIGLEPDPRLIVRRLGYVYERIIAAPGLLERLGTPKNLEDLAENYPLSGFYNSETGKAWDWLIGEQQRLHPQKFRFIANSADSELAVVLAGRCVAMLPENFIKTYLENGELISLFPNLATQPWLVYLYRPYQATPPKRVLFVFDILTEIFKEIYK